MENKNLTILFTDMKDFTPRTSGQSRQATAGGYSPVPVWRRAVAFGVDILLVAVVLAFLTTRERTGIHRQWDEIRARAVEAGFGSADEISEGSPLRPELEAFRNRKSRFIKDRIGLAHLLFILYVFTALSFKGKTFGKHLLKLKVVRTDGSALRYNRAFLRTLLYYLSALPMFLGFLWVFFSKDRTAWHDRISETLVVPDLR
ncbi:RDD family protein [bacterium]|nr:RDD family protein [bacterium]